jgi:hypothetical protein
MITAKQWSELLRRPKLDRAKEGPLDDRLRLCIFDLASTFWDMEQSRRDRSFALLTFFELVYHHCVQCDWPLERVMSVMMLFAAPPKGLS